MKLMVIDGNSILNRAYYGVRALNTADGLFTNAIFGFLSTFLKLREEEAPDRTIVCFDRKEKTFRHERFDTYKATRKGMPEELAMQLPVMKEVLDAMGVCRCELAGFEADDLIGTISRITEEHGDDCLIVTGDRDSLQLVADHTTVKLVSSRMGQDTSRKFTPELFREEYGFDPIRLIDLKSLMGDSSDNISGVPGIGEKGAKELLARFGSLDAIYENIDDPAIKKGTRAKLIAGEQAARDSYWLATIVRDAPLPVDPLHLPDEFADEDALYRLLLRLEFKNFITRLGLSGEAAAPAPERTLKTVPVSGAEDAFARLRAVSKEEKLALFLAGAPDALAFAADGTAYTALAADLGEEGWRELLRRLFSGEYQLVLHDAKEWCVRLMEMGFTPRGIVFDTCIAAYLLAPNDNSFDLERVALAQLGESLPAFNFDASEVYSPIGDRSELLQALAVRADAIGRMAAPLTEKLEERGMRDLYFTIELPLMTLLAEMQHIGCLADTAQLAAFGEMLDGRIAELVDAIYADAGQEFNIQSPKQLGEILFDKLGLPVRKKTKSGYSTSAEILESLAGFHPIIEHVLEYRKLTKLKSTYVEGLLKVVAPDGRIHSHFQQTVTATGRLSSVDPNLQNIPVRTELGRELRRMFVAGEGNVLIDADYSQIELRVLAHMADDEAMIEAFRAGQDIHAATAARVYGVPVEDVTPQMRSSCKAVNFGIVYGISDFSLAGDLGISRKEAGEFIRNYLATYPGVARYMEEIKASAHETGYVTTMFGRRRDIPELASSNFNLRSFGERAAMNTPIQGTAADIIKIAMLRVDQRLKREGLRARLILQVHDELILEAPAEEAETVVPLLREEMERAVTLNVPLVAEAKSGKSWYETK